MGKDVNFDNNGEEFNIALTTSGELNFMANNKNGAGNRRMVIRDGANEVGFDGRITVDSQVQIGGDGEFGSLQLKGDDGVNTIFLGSSELDASMLVGGGGRNGRIQVFDDDTNAAIDLQGASGLLIVGTDGLDGDILVKDDAGSTTIQMDGQVAQLMLKKDNAPTIRLDGLLGYITVGADQEDGTIDLLNDDGRVTIRLSGRDGTIEFFDGGGNSVLTLP